MLNVMRIKLSLVFIDKVRRMNSQHRKRLLRKRKMREMDVGFLGTLEMASFHFISL